MSFSFHLSATAEQAIPVPTIIDRLYPDELVMLDPELAHHGSWPLGYQHLYLRDKSVRSVEIARDMDGVDLRIMSCSNRADHDLARELLKRFALLLDVPIEPEDGTDLTLADLDGDHWAEWAEHSVRSGPGSLVAMVKMRGELITLPGATRDYHLGPKHLAKLLAAGPEERLSDRLLADMRRVQHLDLGDAYEAGVMQVGDEEDGFTLVGVGPDQAYLLPMADRYGLKVGEEEVLQIPWEALVDLLPVEFVDERQALMAAVPEDDWADLLLRAFPFHITDAVAEVMEVKPWWKFW